MAPSTGVPAARCGRRAGRAGPGQAQRSSRPRRAEQPPSLHVTRVAAIALPFTTAEGAEFLPCQSASCAHGTSCLRSLRARHPSRSPRSPPAWSPSWWGSTEWRLVSASCRVIGCRGGILGKHYKASAAGAEVLAVATFWLNKEEAVAEVAFAMGIDLNEYRKALRENLPAGSEVLLASPIQTSTRSSRATRSA
jgi:hypothetical protein